LIALKATVSIRQGTSTDSVEENLYITAVPRSCRRGPSSKMPLHEQGAQKMTYQKHIFMYKVDVMHLDGNYQTNFGNVIKQVVEVMS
jgi:hypothetical protein